MKNFLFATAAALALLAAPAFADTLKVYGVATKPVAGSNYTVKVDPNAQFADNLGGEGFLFVTVDADNDPATADVAGVALSKTPDAVALFQ